MRCSTRMHKPQPNNTVSPIIVYRLENSLYHYTHIFAYYTDKIWYIIIRRFHFVVLLHYYMIIPSFIILPSYVLYLIPTHRYTTFRHIIIWEIMVFLIIIPLHVHHCTQILVIIWPIVTYRQQKLSMSTHLHYYEDHCLSDKMHRNKQF